MVPFDIRITVSNSHVHLSKEHALKLFGNEPEGVFLIGHPKFKNTEKTVTLVGPKGSLESIRVLAPSTKETWVEVNRTHAFALGVRPPLEEGELGSGSIVIRGPCGEVTIEKNVIIELRHLEVTGKQAEQWGLKNGDVVSAEVGGPRALLFRNVKVRIVETLLENFDGVLEIDRDEANAALVNPGDKARIILE